MSLNLPDYLEDAYPLSGMQLGMLFHSLAEGNKGVYIEQICVEMRGENVESEAFKKSWDILVARHAVLRTAFSWEKLKTPIQLVHKSVNIRWEEFDWTHLTELDKTSRLAIFKDTDRKKGVDLTLAPVFRMALIRLSESHIVWIWTRHHIILDGWSTSILLSEFAEIYQQIAQGLKLELKDSKPPPFRDYIAWIRQSDINRSEEFWRRYLQGFSCKTAPVFQKPEVPTAHKSPDLLAGQVSLSLNKNLTQKLTNLSREHKVTLNIIVQAVWCLLIGRHTESDDILWGSTFSGRPQEISGIDAMVGLCINTVPIRQKIDHDQKLGEFLGLLQKNLFEVMLHQTTSLADIQNWSSVDKSVNLFDTVVVFENYPKNFPIEKDTALRFESIEYNEQSDLPMALVVLPEENLELISIFDRTRYTSIQCERVLGQMQHLFFLMVENPDCSVGELHILPPKEKNILRKFSSTTPALKLLSDTKSNDSRYDESEFLDLEFLRLSKLYPEKIAIVFGDKQVTYGELAELSSSYAKGIAFELAKTNVKKCSGDSGILVVGIHLERGVSAIALMLATLQTGACYLMLDPTYPVNRLNLMLEDSGALLVISDSDNIALTKRLGVTFRSVKTLAQQHVPEGTLGCERNVSDLAYLLYTSGSTGKPKGVKVTHKNLTASTRARTAYYNENPTRFLLLSSLSFDSSVAGIYWSLSTGNCLVISKLRSEQDMIGLAKYIFSNQVTHTLCLPSLYRLLLETVSDFGEKEMLSSLETVIVAGEALTARGIVDVHQKLAPTTRLVNEYGPTEATVWCCVYDATNHKVGKVVPIGKPIGNTSLYVLDPTRNLVPVGAQGELAIGGSSISAGYWGDAKRTAEKFINLSIFQEEKQLLYFTGDLARWMEDGNLEYLGRTDRQVKIRGNRVELGEIENCFLRDESVKDAVVTTYQPLDSKENDSAKQLVACVISSLKEHDALGLKARIKEKLSDFMVPTYIEFWERFPRLANGKLDYDEIDKVVGSRISAGRVTKKTVDALNSEEQKILQESWMEVLGQGEIGLNDNFFQIGGDSISSIRVASRLRKLGYTLNPHDLFEAPTLQACAKRLQKTPAVNQIYKHNLSRVELEEVQNTYGKSALFQFGLTGSQRGFLFAHSNHEILDPGHMQIQARLSGTLNQNRFLQALAMVVNKHEALRTALFWKDTINPQQVVFSNSKPKCEFIEMDPDSAQTTIKQYLDRDRAKRIDLENPQAWRMAVFSISSHDHAVCWSCHHSLIDGWSSAVVLDDLIELYRKPESISVGYDSHNQFANYYFWLKTLDLSRLMIEWKNMVQDKKPVGKSGDLLSINSGKSYGRASVLLHCDQVGNIKDSLKISGLTVSQLVHACWGEVLGAVSAEETYGFCSTVSGRNISFSGSHDIVGQLMNHLPIMISQEKSRSLSLYIEQIKNISPLLLRSEFVSPVEFHSWCGPSICTVLRERVALNSLVMVENFPWGDTISAETPTLELVSFQRRGENDLFYEGAATNSFPVTFIAIDANDTIRLQLEFDEALFDLDAAKSLLQAMRDAINTWAKDLTAAETEEFTTAAKHFFQSEEWPVEAGKLKMSQAVRRPLVGIEQSLMLIWKKVFDRELNNVKQSFFDLGGNSMMAVQLTELVRTELGLRMPIAVLFEHNTVEKMAIQLQGQISASFKTLVKIQTEGAGRPVFGIHAEGNVLFYRSLAKALGTNQPFYGLQSPELSGDQKMFRSISQMAGQYIREIKTVQPKGPYTIIGMCFGGWVAFEIAQQLLSNGEEVQSLIILDSEGPTLGKPEKTGGFDSLASENMSAEVTTNIDYESERPTINNSLETLIPKLSLIPRIKKWWEKTTRYSREAPLWVKVIQHHKTGRLRELVIKYIVTVPTIYPLVQKINQPKEDETTQQLFQRILLNQQFLKRQYSPNKYPQGILFIRSEQYEQRTDKQHHIPRWKRVCDGEIEDYLIPGRHLNLMESPQVEQVAEIIFRAHMRKYDEENVKATRQAI